MIKVFGEDARDIEAGQVFIAKINTVEGRKVVTLEPDETYFERQDNPEAFEQEKSDYSPMRCRN